MGTKISMNKHFEINQNVACLRVDCKSESYFSGRYLDENQITAIPSDTFSGLTSLEVL